MKLSEVQDLAVQAIRTSPAFAFADVAEIERPQLVHPEDGTYPKIDGREKALNSRGMFVCVWSPQPTAVVDQISSLGAGAGLYDVTVHVVVEENVQKARRSVEDGGVGMTGLQAVENIISAMVAKGAGACLDGFALQNPPFTDLEMEGGLWRRIVNFQITIPFQPS
jgi:hypothetical protein